MLRTLADNLENQVRLRTTELEERNADVLQQAQELQELSERLLQNQDDERRRIARDLHDSAGQMPPRHSPCTLAASLNVHSPTSGSAKQRKRVRDLCGS